MSHLHAKALIFAILEAIRRIIYKVPYFLYDITPENVLLSNIERIFEHLLLIAMLGTMTDELTPSISLI